MEKCKLLKVMKLKLQITIE